VPPTSPPPATPAPSLATFRGQIVYRGKAVGKEGYWVMRPDGSNKRFLGSSEKLDADFKAQYEKLGYSPDGSRRLYVAKDDQNEQIWYEWNFEGRRYKEQLTDFGRVSYDPVWSPDGGKIAFVSQFHDSDDIWVSDPDGNNMRNLTPNTWEWDKHPTFSPDGRQIAFWSNRDGVRRLYIMDADGRNVRNISGKTDYDEWEPIWIR
jgi:TolB protein